jgi:hypothetical protein
LMWKKDNNSPLLAKLVADVKRLVDERGGNCEVLG